MSNVFTTTHQLKYPTIKIIGTVKYYSKLFFIFIKRYGYHTVGYLNDR